MTVPSDAIGCHRMPSDAIGCHRISMRSVYSVLFCPCAFCAVDLWQISGRSEMARSAGVPGGSSSGYDKPPICFLKHQNSEQKLECLVLLCEKHQKQHFWGNPRFCLFSGPWRMISLSHSFHIRFTIFPHFCRLPGT